MRENEQEIIRRIREKTENIETPEGLSPENIERMLEERPQKKKPGRTMPGRKTLFRAGALAAACIAAVAGIAVYRNIGADRLRTENGTADTRTAGEGAGGSRTDGAEEKISEKRSVATAEDYGEVYEYIERYIEEQKEQEKQARYYDTGEAGEIAIEDSMDTADSAAMAGNAGGGSAAGMAINAETDSAAAMTMNAESGAAHSDTNVRQEGVDEGDVVKTDGRYLYVLKDSRMEVSVVDTADGAMKEVCRVSVPETDHIFELYLNPEKKQMILVCGGYRAMIARGTLSGDTAEKTKVVTYDMSDFDAPKETGRVTQSGYYLSSRMADGFVYLFSSYDVPTADVKRAEPYTFVPLINDAAVAEKDICLPQTDGACMYTVATSVDPDSPDQAADSKAILSGGGSLYVSGENIYYYETVWNDTSDSLMGGDKTTIRSIGYKDGVLTPGAQGTIGGYINDSFSIDEYGGYLRAVTTEGDTNAVYVLDKELATVGSIRGLAEDERVYSARFMGDMGYFVTFRETDPLFSVDLSDPEKPEIVGSLKIPGFSDYLHPYGGGRLLGIGMNVDEETQVTDGVKLTMFDISDPSDVKEEDTYILKNVYSTEASYDYKAVLADAEKDVIGFSGDTGNGRRYYLFGYDGTNGFDMRMEEEINGRGVLGTRGVYIGDTLYVVQGNIIEAYSLKDGGKVDDLIL